MRAVFVRGPSRKVGVSSGVRHEGRGSLRAKRPEVGGPCEAVQVPRGCVAKVRVSRGIRHEARGLERVPVRTSPRMRLFRASSSTDARLPCVSLHGCDSSARIPPQVPICCGALLAYRASFSPQQNPDQWGSWRNRHGRAEFVASPARPSDVYDRTRASLPCNPRTRATAAAPSAHRHRTDRLPQRLVERHALALRQRFHAARVGDDGLVGEALDQGAGDAGVDRGDEADPEG
jgi:hypothetical protein